MVYGFGCLCLYMSVYVCVCVSVFSVCILFFPLFLFLHPPSPYFPSFSSQRANNFIDISPSPKCHLTSTEMKEEKELTILPPKNEKKGKKERKKDGNEIRFSSVKSFSKFHISFSVCVAPRRNGAVDGSLLTVSLKEGSRSRFLELLSDDTIPRKQYLSLFLSPIVWLIVCSVWRLAHVHL